MSEETRIGHVERTRAVRRLEQLVHRGYLEVQDFDERSASATTARTRGELDALFRDIPEHALAPQQKPLPAKRANATPYPNKAYSPASRRGGRRVSGIMIRTSIIAISAILFMALTVAVDNPAPLLLIPILAILLFMLKVGPDSWYED